MSDLISRQAAIDALNGRKTAEQSTFGKARNNVVDWCVNAIKALPSAQPEPLKIDLSGCSKEDWERFRKEWANIPMTVLPEQRTGHWILDRSGAYCCSECMEPCAGYVMMKPRDKFCKMCGAKMEVTE